VTDRWDANTVSYSGDVSLNGGERTPVGVRGAEDVFVGDRAVDGDLALLDAEYVYTATPVDGSTASVDPVTEITGSLEDCYVEPGGADGDVALANVEDVFVGADAASTIDATGAENVFGGAVDAAVLQGASFDVDVSGWKQNTAKDGVEDGVRVRGARADVSVEAVVDRVLVYVVGWENDVRIEGGNVHVDVVVVGRDNTVTAGPYATVSLVAESGHDNDVGSDPYPVEDLVETSKADAIGVGTFGRQQVAFQEPVGDRDTCPNPSCHRAADAIVRRRTLDAFFLFGVPVVTHDATDGAYECEHCTTKLRGEVTLTRDERRDVLD